VKGEKTPTHLTPCFRLALSKRLRGYVYILVGKKSKVVRFEVSTAVTMMIIISQKMIIIKSKVIPVTGCEAPLGRKMLRLPHLLDN
jgi:hypothetical protein